MALRNMKAPKVLMPRCSVPVQYTKLQDADTVIHQYTKPQDTDKVHTSTLSLKVTQHTDQPIILSLKTLT